jgi:PKHD-type hydroxylase
MPLTIKNVLTADELSQARTIIAGAPWAAGRESAGKQAADIKNNEQIPHDCDAARAIRSLVLRGLDRHPTFFSATLPKRVFPPRVNRYGGEMNSFGDHVDNSIRFAPDSGLRIRTDISCTLFFAEPDEYDGGELVIQDTCGPRSIKLAAGDAVIYPGTTLHQVTPVTRGYRLACFFWIESMVRSDEQRRLLFDLDNTIIGMRNEQGDNPSTIALTGTYHNLLRMWADT